MRVFGAQLQASFQLGRVVGSHAAETARLLTLDYSSIFPFTSPASAAALQSHRHVQFVAAWVVPQEEPNGEPLASVYGDLADDGSWRVTLSAPDGTPSGATASYFVRAICVVRDPYPADASSAGDDISQEYAVRSLLVTSSGGDGSGGGPAIPGTTTTTTSTTTTSTTTSTTSTTVAAAGLHSAGLDSPHLDSSYPGTSSYQPKLDSDEQDYSLDAVPASGSRNNDDGGGSDVSGLLLFVAVLAGLGAGGWQLSRFTKR